MIGKDDKMKRIVIVAIVAMAAVFLVACGPREMRSAEEFRVLMEGEGHSVRDITDLFDDDTVESHLIADLGDFEVEFIVFMGEVHARRLFNHFKSEFMAGSGSGASRREVSGNNFSRFIQTTDGRFEAISQIDNTLAIIVTTSDNRSGAEAALGIFGY